MAKASTKAKAPETEYSDEQMDEIVNALIDKMAADIGIIGILLAGGPRRPRLETLQDVIDGTIANCDGAPPVYIDGVEQVLTDRTGKTFGTQIAIVSTLPEGKKFTAASGTVGIYVANLDDEHQGVYLNPDVAQAFCDKLQRCITEARVQLAQTKENVTP